MLKIQKSSSGEVTFTVSGQMNAEHVDELKTLLKSEATARQIVLDLKDLTHASLASLHRLIKNNPFAPLD